MKRIKKIFFVCIISLSLVVMSPSTFIGQDQITHVQAKSTTVYVTKTGTKYHKEKCGNGKYHKTTLVKAKKSKLKPCTKCYGK